MIWLLRNRRISSWSLNDFGLHLFDIAERQRWNAFRSMNNLLVQYKFGTFEDGCLWVAICKADKSPKHGEGKHEDHRASANRDPDVVDLPRNERDCKRDGDDGERYLADDPTTKGDLGEAVNGVVDVEWQLQEFLL